MPRAWLPACRVESDFFSFFCTFICLLLHTSTSRRGGRIKTCLSSSFSPLCRGMRHPHCLNQDDPGSKCGAEWTLIISYIPDMVLDVSYKTFGAGIIVLILESRKLK